MTIRYLFVFLITQFYFFYGQVGATDNKGEIPSNVNIDATEKLREVQEQERNQKKRSQKNSPSSLPLSKKIKSLPSISPLQEPEPKVLGDSLIIDDFESTIQWMPYISRDYGVMSLKNFQMKKNLIEEMAKENNEEKGVLGIKVTYFRKGFYNAYLRPPSEIVIPGITQQFSIWVRTLKDNKHKLYVLFEDSRGREYRVYFRTYNQKISRSYRDENNKYLATSGLKQSEFEWRKYTANVKQSNWKAEVANYGYFKGLAPVQMEKKGITFKGLVLESNIESSYGTYYIYFDQFTVKTKKKNMEEEDGIASDW